MHSCGMISGAAYALRCYSQLFSTVQWLSRYSCPLQVPLGILRQPSPKELLSNTIEERTRLSAHHV